MGVSAKDMLWAIANGEDDPEILSNFARRTASRKGRKRAGIVVAHAMLRIAYYLLTQKEMYVNLGEDYFDKQKQQSIVRHSLRRLESLGYTVTLTESEAS